MTDAPCMHLKLRRNNQKVCRITTHWACTHYNSASENKFYNTTQNVNAVLGIVPEEQALSGTRRNL